ncbi:NUDIX hydrolase [Streptomyces sp. RKCA744]|uniref:NUDIX hydrolase n=1 Tax=Streptomyces sp. RKCA744 TaxID=2959340 RepID=UPI00209D881E|nr:NUDIX domain-containing protein [Streptomyces sp. RKCA744]MCO8308822.1 NUDIX domain-containing protein [Streptomyces sp. RKCA744]
MTTNLSNPAVVELLGAPDLRLVETAPPELTGAQTAAMNRKWEEMTTANPALFDGPVAVCTGAEWTDPETMVLSWCRATYRLLTLRLDPDHAVSAPSLFVSVAQPTNDGHLLVGRMATSTVSSGRWQLPGGTIEPPTAGDGLDADALAGHAARELAEEIGLDVARCDLELWAVTRGTWGNIGIHYRAPARSADTLKDAYAALASSETEQGRIPELDRIDFVRSEADVAGLGGPTADFLPVLLALHSGADAAGRPGSRR